MADCKENLIPCRKRLLTMCAFAFADCSALVNTSQSEQIADHLLIKENDMLL